MHPAGGRRLSIADRKKTFDFTNIREIVSSDNADSSDAELDGLLKKLLVRTGIDRKEARDRLRKIASDASESRPTNMMRHLKDIHVHFLKETNQFKAFKDFIASRVAGQEHDESVPNLSSIVVIAEAEGKRCLPRFQPKAYHTSASRETAALRDSTRPMSLVGQPRSSGDV
jgi:hypothetical protein